MSLSAAKHAAAEYVLLGRRRILIEFVLERKHARYEPLGPGFIYFVLEVIDIVLGKVSEAPLLEQVIANRLAWNLTCGNLLRSAGQPEYAVLDFKQRPD